MKDTLVCVSHNSILCFDITNGELPNIDGMLSTASFTGACLDPNSLHSWDGYANCNVWTLSFPIKGKRDGGRAPAHSFLSHRTSQMVPTQLQRRLKT